MNSQSGLAVVTGAAGGIGGACARRLAQAGYSLLITDVGAASLEAVAEGLRADGAGVEALAGDMADPAFPGRIAAAVGARPFKALVHAAGLSPTMGGPERILDVNLFASARLLDALLPKAEAGTAAVLIASISGHMPASPEAAAAYDAPLAPDGLAELLKFAPTAEAAYALSKRGVLRLVKHRASAWGARGARIASISPGIIDTGMGRAELASHPVMTGMIQGSPLARMGRPEEIAAAAAFLCSADASFVTGRDLTVDGGELAVMGL
ncbi:SDR family oxidoreductase [Phenylobacterium sp.]|jgi:NAD(P)-dependent dehydrogenase (short-subunit alcohol dehydrogenase family)|uniref:SDR family oxidoreductase n=1 Tax=Phenylobacterium sp. TaxID=1871053 RepID=UPI002F3F1D90